ncbi:MAG: molybdopterin molybdenumtransferase MoeA [Gammaproteobacteria bacterium]|nr:molybdopterin molybdenumtransferase MoeA [Gammaproteobacteria bacterium]
MIDKQPSCDDPVQVGLMPVDEARARLQSRLRPIAKIESVTCRDSLGRVLAEPVVSPINVPGQTNSAMDGYAIHSGSIPQNGTAMLNLLGTAWAGQPYTPPVALGEAVRIFTGAIMPDGTDTVVIQEHVEATAEAVTIDSDVVACKNVRQAGEDIKLGEQALSPGVQIGAAEAGLIASLGINEVRVYAPPTVAFFTTGDELRTLDDHAGESLAPGLLFDSNRYTLMGMLSKLGVTTIDLGVVPDSEAATRKVLLEASKSADVIVSSGGVSAGDADYVSRVFQNLGDVAFWKIAMRPGRPLAVGNMGDALFFGLPGNPVAVMVTFLEFVQPAIKTLMGIHDVTPVQFPAECRSSLRKTQGRVEYQRGIFSRDADGKLVVISTGKQGAGRLSSMCLANCMIVLAPEMAKVEPGDCVDIQPFYGLM